MNNYCSNCGHALKEDSRVCPECKTQIQSSSYPRRKLQWNKVQKLNFAYAILLTITLVLIIGAATGVDNSYWSDNVYLDITSMIFGMGTLFLHTIFGFFVFTINKAEFNRGSCSDNQWMLTIYLFIFGILVWFPFITAWYYGNWG